MIKTLQQKGAGFKRTPQRLAILEYLEGNRSHPSAEEVYQAVGRRNPSMSFATVYNTLNTLVGSGALRALNIDPERKRYDPDTSMHHHLLCVACGKIVDLPDSIPVEVPAGAVGDFTVQAFHIEFYGECGACRKKQRKRAD